MNVTNINIEQLLRKVHEIAEATGTDSTNQTHTESNQKVDEFTRKKQEMGQRIREVRNAIQERDEYAASKEGQKDQVELIRKGHAIREQIKELQEESRVMREMLDKDERELERKHKSTEGLANRRKMCDLIDEHIAECDCWFKGNRPNSALDDPAKRSLLKGAKLRDTNPQLVTIVPPTNPNETELEDVEGIADSMLQIQANEQVIDQKLDQILVGSQIVKQISQQISDEYSNLATMDREVDHKMDEVQDKLDNANKQLQVVKQTVGAKGNCCIDIFLVIIIIACIGFMIWKYVA